MKTIILAGGWGSRLGQLTERLPKPMIQIGNKPILWHIMYSYSTFGYNDFIIALGVKSQIIKEYFYNFNEWNEDFTINIKSGEIKFHNQKSKIDWKVTLVDTGINTLKGGRIKRIEKYLDNNINMLTYGDGIADVNISELVEFHKNHGKIITITGVHPPARFGEIIVKENQVISFEEKPQTSVGLINGGYMVFNSELFNYLTPDEDCDFESGVLEKLANKGEVMVWVHGGHWECMDHERDVVHLNKLWKEHKAFWIK